MENVFIKNYSDKSFVVYGSGTKAIKEQLKELGAKPNFNLMIEGEKQFGWIFSNKCYQCVNDYINGAVIISTPIEKKINISKHSVELLKSYMLESMDELKKSILGELDIKSIIMNDTKFLPDDKKRYVFLGGGCGFSFIKYDKRNNLATKIIEDSSNIKKWVEAQMMKSIDKEYLAYLERVGNPLQAHFFQNLEYNSKYNEFIVRYMTKYNFVDIKKSKIWVDNRLD